MKTIDRLMAEHDLIERGLNILEQSVNRIETGESIPAGLAEWIPDFFSQFADRCHHAKEEDLLFPLLEERGLPVEGGPIGVMLHEHEAGRDCVQRLREAAECEDFDKERFVKAARQFIPLLRQHIFKENNVLFQMAAGVLSDADDAEIDAGFSEIERERDLGGLQQRYADEAARWEGEFE